MSNKIAIISSATQLGGTELSSLRICNLLREKDHDVVYICPGSVLQNEMRGIKHIYYKLSRRNPFSIVKAIFTINRVVKKECIDILHCQDAMSCVFCCYARRYLGMKARIIWHERGIRYKKYIKMAHKYSLYIDKIICNSYFERSLLTVNRCPLDKIEVIYNCIEQQIATKEKNDIRKELGLEADDFVLGCVGRLSWEKGFSFLIEAAAECKNDIPNLKIIVVGNGQEMDNIKQIAANVGMTNSVICTGMRRDVANLLTAMDVFAIPSLWEAFGNTTVEAMLARRPVLASRVGGIQEVIQDEINGYLLPSGEIKPWSEKIKYVHDYYEELEPMVEKAYQDACERYSFDVFYEKLIKVYTGTN